MNRETLNTALLFVLTISVATIAFGAVDLRRLMPGGGAVVVTIDEWDALLSPSTLMATGDGSVTIIEFADFQCPYCARAQATLDSLSTRYPGKITRYFRHLPLPMHEHAIAAAESAECAAEQGAFVEYHRLLFSRADSIGIKSWESFAAEAGVNDINDFRACVTERRYSQRVADDAAVAKEHGLTSTPSFVINGKVLPGALPIENFEDIISKVIAPG